MRLEVQGAELDFVEHPLYSLAHPDEGPCDGSRCTQCAVARRRDTGERVLLWLCGDKNWSVSRADPNCARHRAELAA